MKFNYAALINAFEFAMPITRKNRSLIMKTERSDNVF